MNCILPPPFLEYFKNGHFISPFSEYHETCLKTLLTENDFKGAEVSTILAIHLMSKLIFPSYTPYMISNEYFYKPKRCPCYDSHKCRRDVIYGNTGMGKTLNIVVIKFKL